MSLQTLLLRRAVEFPFNSSKYGSIRDDRAFSAFAVTHKEYVLTVKKNTYEYMKILSYMSAKTRLFWIHRCFRRPKLVKKKKN